MAYSETHYGFVWGNCEVECTASTEKGYRVISLKTPREILEVTVTPSGLIRTATTAKRPRDANLSSSS